MPTDEQRMRRQFEKAIAPRCNPNDLILSPMGTYGTEFLELAFMDWTVAWQARDAEVRALRGALTELTECAEDAAKRLPYPRGSLDYAIWQARQQLNGDTDGSPE